MKLKTGEKFLYCHHSYDYVREMIYIGEDSYGTCKAVEEGGSEVIRVELNRVFKDQESADAYKKEKEIKRFNERYLYLKDRLRDIKNEIAEVQNTLKKLGAL